MRQLGSACNFTPVLMKAGDGTFTLHNAIDGSIARIVKSAEVLCRGDCVPPRSLQYHRVLGYRATDLVGYMDGAVIHPNHFTAVAGGAATRYENGAAWTSAVAGSAGASSAWSDGGP